MPRGRFGYIFFLGLLFWGLQTVAQDSINKSPLKVVLIELQENYGFQFNYVESTISEFRVSSPSSSLSFQEVLTYLRVETGLSFHILNNNIVSVLPNNRFLLCGYLKNKDTQEVLSEATIQGLNKSTISDENGFFELEVTSNNEIITIRHLGNKSIVRAFKYFNTQSCENIYLRSQDQVLSTVTLSNYMIFGINKINTGSFEIDFSKFGLLPGLIEADVLYTVQAFPGIQSINETVSNINIRGGTHDQNLILWDEIKMYQSGHFFGLISAFNPQITQKVTLRKNGTTVDYSDGVSGTIAMHTAENVNSKIKGNLAINLIDVSGFVDLPIGKKSSVQIAGRKSLSDFVKTPTYEEYFKRISQDTEVENNVESIVNTDQNFDFYDLSLRWIYQISDKDRLRVNLLYINNKLLFNESAIIDSVETSRESSISQNSFGAGLFYERNWNAEFQTTVQIYESDYKLKSVNVNLFETQTFLQENIVSETSAMAKARYKLNDKYYVHLGYQFLETEVTNLDDVDNPIYRLLISEVVRTHAGFAQLDYLSSDSKSYLNIGLRYNYLDKFQKQLFEPRLNFNHKFLDFFSFDIAGEIKHQITSQVINFQNDFLGVEKRRWQLSNDDEIPVIISKQISFGINYSRSGWLLSADAYYKNVDGITSQSQGFQDQYEFEKSTGSYDVIGLDLLIRKTLKNTSIWLSYSWMNNEYTFDNLQEGSFPSNLDIPHAITTGISYQYKGLKTSIGFNWHSGKHTTAPLIGNEVVNDQINYGPSNSSELEDYFRLDASALYNFNVGKIVVDTGVSVWNILNQTNEINNYYRRNENGEIEEFVQNSLGLTINAVLRVYF